MKKFGSQDRGSRTWRGGRPRGAQGKALWSALAVAALCAGVGALGWWQGGPVLAAVGVILVLVVLGDLPLAAWLDARLGRQVGAEALPGTSAPVARPFQRSACGRMWHGKVRVAGELWHARTFHPVLAEAGEGALVTIVAVERLTLLVVPTGES